MRSHKDVGLPSGPYHVDTAIIRNNVVRRGPWTGGNNMSLELCSVSNVTVAHNTFYSADANYFRTISFCRSDKGAANLGVVLQSNLIRGRVYDPTGGTGLQWSGNLIDGSGTVIVPSWFVSVALGDFHLTNNAAPALNAAPASPDVPGDMDRNLRPAGSGADLGADEVCHEP